MTSLLPDSDALRLPGSDDRLWLWRDILGARAADVLEALLRELPSQQPEVQLFGRRHPIPRRQCWMGDPEAQYRYSGLDLSPLPWHDSVNRVRREVEALSGLHFNSVLINLYRTGEDRMGWHADDEPELGAQPWVASYSIGAMRRFAFRRRGKTRTAYTLELEHDSLLLMGPEIQRHWQHSLPATKRVGAPRINMTFRRITR